MVDRLAWANNRQARPVATLEGGPIDSSLKSRRRSGAPLRGGRRAAGSANNNRTASGDGDFTISNGSPLPRSAGVSNSLHHRKEAAARRAYQNGGPQSSETDSSGRAGTNSFKFRDDRIASLVT